MTNPLFNMNQKNLRMVDNDSKPEIEIFLEPLVDLDFIASPIMFKGHYGDCATMEEVRRQEEQWMRQNLFYIGPDGREYSSMAEVRQAEEEWFKQYKAGLR